jgi:hypothetical protein
MAGVTAPTGHAHLTTATCLASSSGKGEPMGGTQNGLVAICAEDNPPE